MARTPNLTTELLKRIKLELFWAENDDDPALTDDELLTAAQTVLETKLYPLLAEPAEDYITSQVDVSLADPTVNDNAYLYSVPPEAQTRVRSVVYVDSSGREYPPLSRCTESEAKTRFARTGGVPEAYFFRGGRIGLWSLNAGALSGYLRVRFNARPLNLCAIDGEEPLDIYRVLLSVYNTTVGPITYTNFAFTEAADDWENEAFSIQILSKAMPHVILDDLDLGESDWIGPDTFRVNRDSAWPHGIGALRTAAQDGDYVVANYRTPIVQLTQEAFGCLVAGTALYGARSRSDAEHYGLLEKAWTESVGILRKALMPRNDQDPAILVNHDGPTMSRMRGGDGPGWRR